MVQTPAAFSSSTARAMFTTSAIRHVMHRPGRGLGRRPVERRRPPRLPHHPGPARPHPPSAGSPRRSADPRPRRARRSRRRIQRRRERLDRASARQRVDVGDHALVHAVARLASSASRVTRRTGTRSSSASSSSCAIRASSRSATRSDRDAPGTQGFHHRVHSVDQHQERPGVLRSAVGTSNTYLPTLDSASVGAGAGQLAHLEHAAVRHTRRTRVVLAMSASGSPSTMMRSASLPASMVPAFRLSAFAGFTVAVFSASNVRHARHGVRHQLAVQVHGVRRVGAGHHQAAGLHHVEHHLAAAAARIAATAGLAAAGCCATCRCIHSG